MNFYLNRLVCLLALLVLLVFWGSQVAAATLSKNHPQRISIANVQKIQTNGEDILFIDTRTNLQWSRADKKLPGAVRLASARDIRELVKSYPPDTPIVTYCT